MIKQFIKSFLILLPFISSSQNLSQNSLDSTLVQDTIQVYKCTFSIIQHGDSTSYEIDGKPATKVEFEKITKGFKEKKKCNPCVLKKVNLDGSIDSEGLFYYTCPGSDEKTEFKTNTKENANIFIHINSCNDGEWRFYSKDGKVLEIKYFDHGTEVKTKGKLFQ